MKMLFCMATVVNGTLALVVALPIAPIVNTGPLVWVFGANAILLFCALAYILHAERNP